MEAVDGIFGKAEEYFGRKVTAAGLAIVAAGAVSASVRSVWTNIVQPLLTLYEKTGITAAFVIGLICTLILLGTGYQVISGFLTNRAEARALLETRETLDQAKRLLSEADEENEKVKQLTRSTNDNVTLSNLLMEAATTLLIEQGTIGQEKADLILSLVSSTAVNQPSSSAHST